MVVEVVEADFAPGNYFWVSGEAGELIEMLGRRFLGFVRMDTDAGVDPVVLLRVRQSGVEFCRARAGADGQQSLHTGFSGAVQHGVTVFGKLWVVDVRVGVDEFHDHSKGVPLPWE